MGKLIRKHAILLTLLLVLAIMTMIFCFSSQKAEASNRSSDGIVQRLIRLLFRDYDRMDPERRMTIAAITAKLVRKGAHFAEYAMLGLALLLHMLALMTRRPIRRPAILAWGIGALYAASDEFHQSFVSGRSGEVADVLLDSVGVLFGVLFLRWMLEIRRKRRIKREPAAEAEKAR